VERFYIHKEAPTENQLNNKERIFPNKIFDAILKLSDPTLDLVRQYDFPVPLRQYDFPVPLQCQKTSYMVFVAFVHLLLEPVPRFSSCSTDFSKQIAQVVLFLFLGMPCVLM
jgi:hypothetical protein